MRTVYIESIFLLNIVMNIYLFRLTSKLTRTSTTFLRILEGSMVGAAAFCISLMIREHGRLLGVFIMILTSVGTCWMVFRSRSLRELLRLTGVIYTITFLVGGIFLFVEKQFPFLKNMRYSVGLLLFTGTLISEGVSWGIRKILKRHDCNSCMVQLEGDCGKIQVRALIDTGNCLVEPISGKCVSVLEARIWEQMKRFMKPEKLKMIPYHTLGKKQGLMEGYEIEEMRVICQGSEKLCQQVILAVYQGNISSKQTYQMIVPSELFTL